MGKENKVMSDFQLKLIADFHKDFDRQGPGSEETTKLALQLIGGLPDNAVIGDLGCGTGTQTITLAKKLNGTIKAVDFIPEFIESLNCKISKSGFEDIIKTYNISMDQLPFSPNEFDLLWAEGSIYNIGFENGLKYLWKFLKPGGFIAVSEVSWFTKTRPAEIEKFWNESYPEIDTVSRKIEIMSDSGYLPVAHFVLPQEDWWNYFRPMPQYAEDFLRRNGYSKEAGEFLKYNLDEIELYDKFKEYYGYVFYIGQKII